ncbi:MAG: endonuclease/exonuclease/phosphatase family protein [bacterium]|nr:endonuclease/exonuclease/phosphatase family protein [bacterium]
MKIVSLNLWNGGRLFEQAKQFLVEQNADIYFLQETYDGRRTDIEPRFRMVEELKEVFPTHDAYFAPLYLDTRKGEGDIEDGNLLLSRWPLVERKNIFIDIPYGRYDQDAMTDWSKSPSTIQKARITVGNSDITLLNVHGPWNLNGTIDDERRGRMKEIILREISEHTIVAGDFNVRPETNTIRAIEEKLTNVFKRTLSTTFNLQRKNLDVRPGYAIAVVDMVFVTSNFQIQSKHCLQVDVSDHLPLVAEIELLP